MQTSFKNITDTEQELTIIYPLGDYQAKLNEAFSSLRSKVKLDGFRPGKAPFHIIKKMYGESVEADELSKLAGEIIPQVLSENKLFVVSQPHLHKLEVTDYGVEIVAHYHIVPDFELKDYKSLIVDEPVHRVTDDEIEEVIESFVYNSDNFEESETVEDQNYVVHIQRVKEEDSDKPEETEQQDENTDLEDYTEFPVVVRDKRYSPKFTSLLLGKKVGDEVSYTPEHNHDHDEHDHDHDHEHKPVTFKITKIEKIIPNEINEEYIQQMTDNKFSSLEDWKENIGFDLQSNYDNESRRILEDNLIEKIIEIHDIKIPDFTILEQAQKMFEEDKKNKNNKNVSFENQEIKEFYLNVAQKVIKWELIREKIINAENIEVEEYDLDGFIDNYSQYYPDFDKDLLRKTILDNKQILDTILVKKLMDLLIDFTTTNEVDMDLDKTLNASLFGDFYEDDDFDDEDDDIFDADEEFIDEEEFDDEFFDEDFDDEDDDFDDDDFDDDEDDEDDDDEFDDED